MSTPRRFVTGVPLVSLYSLHPAINTWPAVFVHIRCPARGIMRAAPTALMVRPDPVVRARKYRARPTSACPLRAGIGQGDRHLAEHDTGDRAPRQPHLSGAMRLTCINDPKITNYRCRNRPGTNRKTRTVIPAVDDHEIPRGGPLTIT
jgi:hypothetical protein